MKYEIGSTIRFIDSMKPLVIKSAVITGYDTQDRVLATYEYHDGLLSRNASIHHSRILPDRIER